MVNDTHETAANNANNDRMRTNMKYSWHRIAVGKAATIKATDPKVIKSAINSAYGYGKRTGKVFTVKRSTTPAGDTGVIIHSVRIWRLS